MKSVNRISRLSRIAVVALAGIAVFGIGGLVFGSSPPLTSLSPIPMTMVSPAHPQVLIAIGNSQSMDGDLSGAIMTGSGTADSALQTSSSPLDYTVPSGFTPPCNATVTGGLAPYTVSNNGVLCDNSASRLNVAKEAIQSILSTYAGDTDFGLLDYQTSSASLYTTWVYYMSEAGGFTFSSSNTTALASGEYVPNPCYLQTGTGTVPTDCSALGTFLSSNSVSGVLTDPYMVVQNSSDDPDINDVLYDSGGLSPVCMVYGPITGATPYPGSGPTPATPYPPNFSLANYENGTIGETYKDEINTCAKQTGPTNAGFVPYQAQTMYAERGFGYYSSVSASTGKLVLPMQTAGTNATPAQVQAMIAKFTPYLQPETNSTDSSEIKALAVQSPIAGMLAKANSYLPTTASSNGCTPKRYVILVTDGLPTMDLEGNNWPPLGSQAATGYGVTATFNADGSLASTNDQALQDTINELTTLNNAGIRTFIVGVGAGVDVSANPQAAATLEAMAIAGGNTKAPYYYAATNAQQVTTDLQTILNAIQAGTYTGSSAAANSTGLNAGTTMYVAQYVPSDQPWNDWTGNLLAYSVNSKGFVNTASPLWQAQSELDAMAGGSGWSTTRLIATCIPTAGICGNGSGVPFEWTDLSTTEQADLMTSTTDTLGLARLDYLRGDKADEQQNGGQFRNRSHLLGDIVDSSPVYVAQASGLFMNNAGYASYVTSTQNREPMIYVGANDGMLHAFDATTGEEKFAFVPSDVFPNLINLTEPAYNQEHQFFVDGSPIAGDVTFADGSWHTILTGGLNGGGNSIYALDVTNPSGITNEAQLASDVLWEFTSPDLGYTFSAPFIAQTNIGSTYSATPFLVFFGSGYNDSVSNDDYLFALNAQTGQQVTKTGSSPAPIDLCTSVNPDPCSSTLPNGLSSVTVVNSSGNLGAPADTLYAGDLQGNLWKVDISNADPSKWVVTLLFQARDPSGNPQPITTAPVVSLNPNFPQVTYPMVYFGTGQLLGPPDISNTQVQTFYGIEDEAVTGSSYTPPTRSNLVQQVLTDTTATVCVDTGAAGTPPPCTTETFPVRTITSNPVNLATNPGWYVDLGSAVSASDTGERVVTQPQLVEGAVDFNTYIPQQNSCSAGGSTWFLSLNYATGGGFPQPQIDLNKDGSLNSSDQVNGQNPVGMNLGPGFVPAATVLTSPSGNPTVEDNKTPIGTRGPTLTRTWEQIFQY